MSKSEQRKSSSRSHHRSVESSRPIRDQDRSRSGPYKSSDNRPSFNKGRYNNNSNDRNRPQRFDSTFDRRRDRKIREPDNNWRRSEGQRRDDNNANDFSSTSNQYNSFKPRFNANNRPTAVNMHHDQNNTTSSMMVQQQLQVQLGPTKPVLNLLDPTQVPKGRSYFEHEDRGGEYPRFFRSRRPPMRNSNGFEAGNDRKFNNYYNVQQRQQEASNYNNNSTSNSTTQDGDYFWSHDKFEELESIAQQKPINKEENKDQKIKVKNNTHQDSVKK